MGTRATTTRRRRPADEVAYSYLLGIYLGDGSLGETHRSVQFRVTLAARYPGIVEEVALAMSAVHPTVNVRRRTRPGFNVDIIDAASVSWPLLFPQHGPGRKHLRRIALVDWQQRIVDDHPEPFIRGLIHSDGCRTVNRFTTTLPSGRVAQYAYPPYFFTNESADILAIFRAACDAIGVRTTRSSRKNVSISDRRSVAQLDEFVGPKC